jgi:hypothetical protein
MKSPRYFLLLVLFLAAIVLPGVASDGPQELFNGRDLTGWDTYLGPRYDTAEKKFAGPHVGLNTDPDGVFSVVQADGAPAIRISGVVWGGISTHAEFENYHLRLQFKWGEARYAPRATARRDSGLLYHAVGPHAAGWFFWMRSQEFQIQEHDVGDYWEIGGTRIKTHVRTEGPAEKPSYFYSPAGELETFLAAAKTGGRIRHCFDAELPHGQWNTLDLYCIGQTSMHVVNGVVVMVLRESEQPDGQGGFIPLTKGKIQLQSEGAEVFYRAITVEPIDGFPNLQVAVSP